MNNNNDFTIHHIGTTTATAPNTNTLNKINKRNKKNGIKTKLLIVSAIILVSLIFYSLYKINQFFDTYKINFQAPVGIKTQWPIYTTIRVQKVLLEVTGAPQNSPLNANQQYICNKFGNDCKLALAIQHAEDGNGDCSRINWSNTDHSIDIGLFQINTLWLNKDLVQPGQLFDCKANVDFAYQIYKRNGDSFKEWTSFQNKSYQKYLY